MDKSRIGIIGGSGLYKIEGIKIKERRFVDTPFGDPSDEVDICELEDREIVFLPRHGRGHRILPGEINYRANIYALKKLGVEWIISLSAVGSLKKEIRPLDMVLVDQFIDRTYGRKSTFFGEGIAAHVAMANPLCPELRRIVFEAAHEEGMGANIHWGGTYINIEGPAFSTRAESNLYRSWGVDVIGMTNLTEAKLAREAEICYMTVAMVTDYDCWIEDNPEESVAVDLIVENLNKNVEIAKRIIRRSVKNISEVRNCECKTALKNAIITKQDKIPKSVKARLGLLIKKYVE